MSKNITAFIANQMTKGGRCVAARLQAALALLEKLRHDASLELSDHLASKGSSGLESHETFGNQAHARLNLVPINKNHGRRSSNLREWGQDLLEIMEVTGFLAASSEDRNELISEAQALLSVPLRHILDQEPLEVRPRGRSAEWTVGEILDQAEEKGKSGDVAQYLVGAKLRLRLEIDIPALPANKGDRKSRGDQQARAGDFQVEDAVLEVALGLPDEKHLTQVVDALEESDSEIWLLTRAERVETWRRELGKLIGAEMKRVIVVSVEAFVGQNISELGRFSAKGKADRLNALFEIYNKHWIDAVGTPGIRIVLK